ncbi:Cupredoxin, partial [Mycena polygramma]
MRFSLAVAAAILPVLSVSAADILVLVGADNKLVFSPSNITAAAGDTIAFQFQNKNHSVTQSTFADPCAIQTTPAQGIDSGFQFVAANATQLPQWSFTVDNASTPLWFFCAQTTHCEAGMVFSVNAVESGPKNFAAYQAAAMAGNAAAGAGSAIASGAAAATSAAGSDIAAATSAAAGAAGAAG